MFRKVCERHCLLLYGMCDAGFSDVCEALSLLTCVKCSFIDKHGVIL